MRNCALRHLSQAFRNENGSAKSNFLNLGGTWLMALDFPMESPLPATLEALARPAPVFIETRFAKSLKHGACALGL
jgi:hypothetical protein